MLSLPKHLIEGPVSSVDLAKRERAIEAFLDPESFFARAKNAFLDLMKQWGIGSAKVEETYAMKFKRELEAVRNEK